MTIRKQPENIQDKILKLLGKERKILIPEKADEIYRDKGPYVNIKAKRENFWKALMRDQKGKNKDELE